MDTPRRLGRTAANVAATYGAWIVTSVLGVGVFIEWHTALLRAYAALGLNRYGIAAFNNTVVIVLVLIWLVLVMATEGLYRRAASEGALGRRFLRTTLTQVALWAVAFIVARLV